MKSSAAVLVALCVVVTTTLAALKMSGRAAQAAANGAAIYADRCAICHESSGEGVIGTFPPLAKNPHVTANDPSAAIVAVLNGMLVDVTVQGHRYVGGMPGWRNWLSDADVAAVVTYIRTSWGNHASAVSPGQVARIRGGSSILTP